MTIQTDGRARPSNGPPQTLDPAQILQTPGSSLDKMNADVQSLGMETRTRRRAGHAIATILLVAAAVATALGMTTAPAAAASPCSQVSCTYNYSGSSSLLACWDSGCPVGTYAWWGNGNKVSMACWFDDPNHWFNGNYNSDRWFVVWAVPLAGRWVVHSSYVFNQTNTGHC